MNYPINVFTNVYRKDTVKSYEMVDELGTKSNWDELVSFIEENGCEDHVNCCRLPVSNENTLPLLFTPLHYAAAGNAPKEIITTLIEMGASKCLKNSDGKTAYDLGVDIGLDSDKLDLLKIPNDIKQNAMVIQKMEEGLNNVIKGRVEDLINKNGQSLPQLSYLFEKGSFYYAVPGMYGGFNVSQHKDGIEADSWIRVCGGSEQTHVVDKDGNIKLLPNDNPL